VTNSGDDGGFHPHPGDPVHPGPTEESAADDAAPSESESFDETAPKRRRGLFRRRPVDGPVEDPEEVDAVIDLGDAESPSGPIDDAPRSEGPSGAPPDEQKDPTLTVELPSWVGETTVGADGVVAGFEDTLLPDGGHEEPEAGIEEVDVAEPMSPETSTVESGDATEDAATGGSPVPSPERESDDEPLAMTLPGFSDVAADDDDGMPSPGEVEGAALEASPGPGHADPSPEAAAAESEYGVAGRDAFDALRDIDQEDLGAWEDFVSTEPAAARNLHEEPLVGITERPEPEAFDEWVEEDGEAPKRRGIWPFRRRRDREADDGYDAEWVGDTEMIPEDPFAEVEEGGVVSAAAQLPEDEWPEPEPQYGSDPEYVAAPDDADAYEAAYRPAPGDGDEAGYGGEYPPTEDGAVAAMTDAAFEDAAAVPADPGGWEVPAGAHGRLEDPDGPDSIGYPDDASIDESVPAAAFDEPDADYEPAFDHGSGFESIPELEDDAMFRPPGDRETARAWPGEPVPAPDRGGTDDDEWVTGPIDLGEDHDDATVELPTAYASADDITEQIYTTSVTTEHRGFAEELDRFGEEDTEWQAISAAMPGVGTGVVGFDDVADLGDEEDVYQAPSRSELGTRALTGVVLVGFLLGTVWVGGAAAAAFVGLLVALGLGEFYGTLRHRGFRPLAIFGYLGGIGLYAATWFHGPIAIPVGLGLAAVMVFFVYAFAPTRRDALTNGGLTLLGIAWVMATAAFAVPILESTHYKQLLLAVVVVTAAMDIGAYSVGRTWGRRALAPVLSPNKSVEGLIGGIVTCMAAAVALGYFIEPFDLGSGIALGLVICVAAPIGDLAESMIKRSLGVKDMGTILPGHGGILDRIDAFLFVIPAAWVLFTINGLLG